MAENAKIKEIAMSIAALSIADSATSIAVTGGTAQVFSPDGVEVANGQHVAAAAVTDFRVRPHATFINKVPQRRGDGTYSYGTREIRFTEPYLHTDGKVYFVNYTVVCRYAPEVPAANQKNARFKTAQLLFDSDLESYNTAGDLT